MEHINQSITKVDDNQWLIGTHLLLSRERSTSSSNPTWSDGKGSFFVLSESPQPLPKSAPLSETSEIQKIYDAGDVSAVWRVGEAIVKVKELLPEATREHITLQCLHNKRFAGFVLPSVYHHSESNRRYYLVLQRLPGQTLGEIWPSMNESTKQDYVCQVANICSQLTTWQGTDITGVDGNQLSDDYLRNKGKSYDPKELLSQCQKAGMNCSLLVFYHCDLGPGNIILDPTSNGIGIIDWETAGFVPKEWVRTKFRISSGLDLPNVEDETEWRRLVSRELASMGYSDVAYEWLEYRKSMAD